MIDKPEEKIKGSFNCKYTDTDITKDDRPGSNITIATTGGASDDLILFGLVRCILHSIWHTKTYIKVTRWRVINCYAI